MVPLCQWRNTWYWSIPRMAILGKYLKTRRVFGYWKKNIFQRNSSWRSPRCLWRTLEKKKTNIEHSISYPDPAKWGNSWGRHAEICWNIAVMLNLGRRGSMRQMQSHSQSLDTCYHPDVDLPMLTATCVSAVCTVVTDHRGHWSNARFH